MISGMNQRKSMMLSLWVSVALLAASAQGATEIIVDNQDSNTYSSGTWSASSGVNPYNGQSLYSNSGSVFRWMPEVIEAGEYKVYAWWTAHTNRSTTVPFRVTHVSGTSAPILVNMKDSALGGQWNELGTFTFAIGSSGFVEVSSENGQACADAIRIEKIESQPPPPPPVEVIVDNQDANTSRTGTWSPSSGINPYNGQSLYSNSGSTFRWTPDLKAGTFKVYAWWTAHNNRSTTVPFRISHAGGTSAPVIVDMRNSSLGGQWNELGTFTFVAGTLGYVEVSSENGQACADAIRFVPESGSGDTTPPVLMIASVSLTGTATDDAGGVSVTVNGESVNVSSSNWSSSDLPVNTGANFVAVVATDEAGNQTNKTVQVDVSE